MRSDTQSITIERDAREVYEYIANLASLPQWATGFAPAVRHEKGRWLVDTPSGAS